MSPTIHRYKKKIKVDPNFESGDEKKFLRETK
jgi:hypothetical protein